MKFKYEVVGLSLNIWKGRYEEDYLKIINERGEDGWRFIGFVPTTALPKGAKGVELLFEKAVGAK